MKPTTKRIPVDLITPLEDQIKALGITNYLNMSYIKDLHESRPYLDNVDDGKAMCNISPKDAIKKFEKQGRLGLTLREGLALFRSNPKILKSHYLDFVGTRCYEVFVPHLYVYDVKPALNGYWEDVAHPKWGAPSAGSVSDIGFRNLAHSDLGSLEARVKALEAWKDKITQA